jgi:hypothetical protein
LVLLRSALGVYGSPYRDSIPFVVVYRFRAPLHLGNAQRGAGSDQFQLPFGEPASRFTMDAIERSGKWKKVKIASSFGTV